MQVYDIKNNGNNNLNIIIIKILQAEKLSQELLRVKQKLSILNQSQSPLDVITQSEGIEQPKLCMYACISCRYAVFN